MVEAIIAGISSLFQLDIMLLILAGIILGLVLGVIPGIGGIIGIVMLMPVFYVMDPMPAITLLIAIHAVSCTGGSISSIVLNIPGTPANVATLFDGYPMTEKGEGGRAIGAALMASLLGGVFGGVLLAFFIPLVRPVVLAFGSPETLVIIIIGIAFIGLLSGASKIKGLIAGGLGMLVGMIGYDPVTATPRFYLGSVYLLDGLPLIPVLLGIFAIPQIMNLFSGQQVVDKAKLAAASRISGVTQGVMDVFRHWWLFIRSSIVGVIVGIIPGIGGESAPYIAYGQGKQLSKHPETWGKGTVEGVIAPEASNNAKEGGALMPTLAFGIPGSTYMVLLLGVFQVKGIPFGSALFKSHLDLVWVIVGCLILSNVVGALIALGTARYMAKIALVPSYILAPLLLSICLASTYIIRHAPFDFIVLIVIGIIGYLMGRYGYARPAFILGFILVQLAERYYHLSMDAYGLAFLSRPIVVALLVLLAAGLFYSPIRNLVRQWRSK